MIKKAKNIARIKKLSEEALAGEVGCALVTDKGKVYVGVSIHAACGIGFCAEHTAIASMITKAESRIETIVAVSEDGRILPPCGRCRELILEVNPENIETNIVLGEKKVAKLKDLLPERWQDSF